MYAGAIHARCHTAAMAGEIHNISKPQKEQLAVRAVGTRHLLLQESIQCKRYLDTQGLVIQGE